MQYILTLRMKNLRKLIETAQEKSEREDLFKLYCSSFPHFTEENKMAFNEFCELFKPNVTFESDKSDEELMFELLATKGGNF